MDNLKIKLDKLLSEISKKRMTSKEYDEMESVDLVMSLNIPNLDVSLARELIEASFCLQKQNLANKKLMEASNRNYMHSDIVDFKKGIKESQMHLNEINKYYNDLIANVIGPLEQKEVRK